MALTFLSEGDKTYIQGSGKNPYEIKKVGGVVSCSCPAWRNLGGPIDTRVCKHIKANIDPACLLPQALSTVSTIAATPPKAPKLTKTGKVSTAVGGTVVKDTAPPVLLAHRWEDEDPAGRWMSEKLDGVRAWWDGKNFVSRLGNIYHAPEWFTKLLPKDVVLDGELWIGRGKFQNTVSAVRKLIPDDAEWLNVTYVIFDAPKQPGTFEERMTYLEEHFPVMRFNGGEGIGHVCVLEQVKCKNAKHLKTFLTLIEARSGEGVMLREANSMYEEGRSKTLLKVKTFIDDEAVVLEHIEGRGKHKGRMGALLCRMSNGVEFEVGTGFSDEERKNPPAIGSTITFRYQELTSAEKKPRFASFISERDYE